MGRPPRAVTSSPMAASYAELRRGGLNFRLRLRGHRQQQTAGGLRIAQQIPPLRRHLAHEMAVAGKVAPGAARHRAGGDIVLHPGSFGISA